MTQPVENFIPPENPVGWIRPTPPHFVPKFFVSDCRMSLSEVRGRHMFHLFAESHHFEMHRGTKVRVGDLMYEFILPVEQGLELGERTVLHFPLPSRELEENWETLYHSTYYDNEHLALFDATITICRESPGSFVVTTEARVGELSGVQENQSMASEVRVNLSHELNAKCNWHFRS